MQRMLSLEETSANNSTVDRHLGVVGFDIAITRLNQSTELSSAAFAAVVVIAVLFVVSILSGVSGVSKKR